MAFCRALLALACIATASAAATPAEWAALELDQLPGEKQFEISSGILPEEKQEDMEPEQRYNEHPLPVEAPPPGGWMGFFFSGVETGVSFAMQGVDSFIRFFSDPEFNFQKEGEEYVDHGSSTINTFGEYVDGVLPEGATDEAKAKAEAWAEEHGIELPHQAEDALVRDSHAAYKRTSLPLVSLGVAASALVVLAVLKARRLRSKAPVAKPSMV